MYTLSRAFLDPRRFSACLLHDAGARNYVYNYQPIEKPLIAAVTVWTPHPHSPLLEGGGSGGGGGGSTFSKLLEKRGGIVSTPTKIRGYLVFEIWTKRGVMKKLLRKGVLLERGGGSKLFHQFSLQKACFHYYWNFCLVNIHTCYNQ